MRGGWVGGGGVRGQQTIHQLFRRTPVRFPVIAADRLLLCKCLRLRGEEAAGCRGRGAMPCDGVHNDGHYLTGIEPGEGHLEHFSQLTNSRAPFSLPTPTPSPSQTSAGWTVKPFRSPGRCFRSRSAVGSCFFT